MSWTHLHGGFPTPLRNYEIKAPSKARCADSLRDARGSGDLHAREVLAIQRHLERTSSAEQLKRYELEQSPRTVGEDGWLETSDNKRSSGTIFPKASYDRSLAGFERRQCVVDFTRDISPVRLV